MNTGFDGLGIDSLSTGISAKGMEGYKESLRADLLITSKEKINNFSELQLALEKGWQGASLDKFKTQFTETAQKICDDLDKEYQDLENRLSDLETAYFNVDNNVMGE